jgi:RHS repeat-associated protein
MNAANPNDLYKFTGHERDAEVGLDYMLARNYDPEIGRFLSVDPRSSERAWVSPYNYTQNDPINRFDPSGEIDLKKTLQGGGVTAAGVGQVAVGVALAAAAGPIVAATGAALIVSGAITTGLGLGKTAVGISERGMDVNIPGGTAELAGLAADKSTGGDGSLQTVGKIADAAINIVTAVVGAGGMQFAAEATTVRNAAVEGSKNLATSFFNVLKDTFKAGATSTREAASRGSALKPVIDAIDAVGVVNDAKTIVDPEKKK